jgi:hypothetical protein
MTIVFDNVKVIDDFENSSLSRRWGWQTDLSGLRREWKERS